MRDKLNQFILNVQMQFIEVSDRNNIYQCMDLAYLWVFCLGFPKATIQKLYAYEVYTKPTDLTRQYFDIIPNSPTFIPEDGDLAVFDKTATNIAGHIGVALGGGTVTTFRDFEQNWPVGTNALVRVRNYNTPKLLGVLRPKQQLLPESQIVQTLDLSSLDDNTPLKEQYGILNKQQIEAKFTAKDTMIKIQEGKILAARKDLS